MDPPKVPKQHFERLELEQLRLQTALHTFDAMKKLEHDTLTASLKESQERLRHLKEMDEWRESVDRQLKILKQAVDKLSKNG